MENSQMLQYNNEFLDRIIVSMITDKQFLLKTMDLQISQYIQSQPHIWYADFIISFFKRYKVQPTMQSLKIKIESLNQKLLKQILSSTYISILQAFQEPNLDFIKTTVIQFCRFQQIKKAITKSIDLLQDQNQDYEQIYQLINKTRFKGLQSSLGVQYVEGFERRHKNKIRRFTQTPWSVINNALNGGTQESTLNLILAPPGCVTQDTIVYLQDGSSIQIHQVEKMLIQKKPVYVKTIENRFTKVTDYVKKGILETFEVKTWSGKSIKVSNDHLFYNFKNGWIRTSELSVGDYILCQNQLYQQVVQINHIGKHNIVDITVQDPQACYYGNGILNHNTGKTWMLINIAAHCLKLGKKVVYYTLQMTQDEVGCRVDFKILDKSQHYLSDPNNFQKAIKELEPYKDNLRIKQYMPNLTTVSQIENHLTQLYTFQDFNADVIIIDYADILKKQTGGDNMYLSYGDVYTNLKRLAKAHKKVIWSASQGNRCLDQNTLVHTLQNGINKIGDIEVGDHIQTPHGHSRVKEVYRDKQKVYTIKFKDGRQVTCSGNHMFPTQSGEFKSIEQGLSSGQKLIFKK